MAGNLFFPGNRDDLRRLLSRVARGRRPAAAGGELRGAVRRAGLSGSGEAGPQWLREFDFPAALNEIPSARRMVAEQAEACGLDGPALFDLLLAVGEALANAVKHGSPDRRQDRVRVRVGIFGAAVAVEVSDRGPGFAASRLGPPPAHQPAGRGIPFMRALVDGLSFDTEHGTSVLLVKRLE
jgi:anti-sigma regulatory factor (Ser/Thr protein kinase)